MVCTAVLMTACLLAVLAANWHEGTASPAAQTACMIICFAGLVAQLLCTICHSAAGAMLDWMDYYAVSARSAAQARLDDAMHACRQQFACTLVRWQLLPVLWVCCCRIDDNTIVAVVIPENAGPPPSRPPVSVPPFHSCTAAVIVLI
jgi:hypothetical protein